MARNITDKRGRTVSERDPDYAKVRIDNLEETVHELVTAVIDLQNRVSRLDGEDLLWPGDSYEPRYTEPFKGSKG